MPRRIATRGMAINTVSPFRTVHVSIICASVALASTSRNLLRRSSNCCTKPAVVVGTTCGGNGAAKSTSVLSSVNEPHHGKSVRWLASLLNGQDLGCGEKSSLASGTRSSMRRVFAISCSRSARADWAIMDMKGGGKRGSDGNSARQASTSAGVSISNIPRRSGTESVRSSANSGFAPRSLVSASSQGQSVLGRTAGIPRIIEASSTPSRATYWDAQRIVPYRDVSISARR